MRGWCVIWLRRCNVPHTSHQTTNMSHTNSQFVRRVASSNADRKACPDHRSCSACLSETEGCLWISSIGSCIGQQDRRRHMEHRAFMITNVHGCASTIAVVQKLVQAPMTSTKIMTKHYVPIVNVEQRADMMTWSTLITVLLLSLFT